MTQAVADDLAREVSRLNRRLMRERETRQQAEAIAERGLRELYQQQRELEFLMATADMANQSGSLTDVLEAALAHLCHFVGWSAAHAYILSGPLDRRCMLPTRIWHVEPGLDMHVLQEATAECILALGEGMSGRAWSSGAPVWISDFTQEDRFLCPAAAAACGMRAGLAVPLLIEAEVVAVLEFFAELPRREDAALLRLLARAGAQLGRVIERDRANDRLHDALHDALTGLPNRANFTHGLEQALRHYRLDRRVGLCVLFIDLDHFKFVNDSLGHAAGDELLMQAARRLRAAIRRDDPISATADAEPERVLARLGGDEFTVLLRGIDDSAVALRVAERIQQAFQAPFPVHGRDVVIGASIGIAAATPEHLDAGEILRNADLAMYHAKEHGKGRSEVYDAAMHTAAMARMSLEGDLRAAVRNGDFILHYQPIVNLAHGRIVGFEALLRWQVSPGVLRPPNDFIRVAEETGLIVPLGLFVLTEACRTLRAWNDVWCGAGPRTMSVNLSARQFAEGDLVAQVQRVIAESGIEPAWLRLEITETVAMEDAERAIKVLIALRDLGVRISLDDFGTGFSSLSYLHRFPLQLLKIDRSFVSRMEAHPESLQIVKTIITLARTLDMEVIAEGAETEAEVERLRSLGCQYCQGFYFSRPLAREAAEAMLANEGDSRLVSQ